MDFKKYRVMITYDFLDKCEECGGKLLYCEIISQEDYENGKLDKVIDYFTCHENNYEIEIKEYMKDFENNKEIGL